MASTSNARTPYEQPRQRAWTKRALAACAVAPILVSVLLATPVMAESLRAPARAHRSFQVSLVVQSACQVSTSAPAGARAEDVAVSVECHGDVSPQVTTEEMFIAEAGRTFLVTTVEF